MAGTRRRTRRPNTGSAVSAASRPTILQFPGECPETFIEVFGTVPTDAEDSFSVESSGVSGGNIDQTNDRGISEQELNG